MPSERQEAELVTITFTMLEAVDLEVALMDRAEATDLSDEQRAEAEYLRRKVSRHVKQRWPGI